MVGGALRTFEVIQEEIRITESTPIAFSLIIYSASSCLITDLYYVYEKGRFDFDFFAEAVVIGKTIFKLSLMRGCGGSGPEEDAIKFCFFL